ncbi:hypothetical protein AcV5_001588 [Taiwanofungus camphoratus]|nr:hypothetical protein AcV5_001588 [Antrodia cinnamomea]KAI0922396.1 hypothetical protein AcV7_005940 [Antrodia cinnamomea]
MATPVENPIVLNLMSSYGPILIGNVLSCVLWGIGCMQMFMYFFQAFDTANQVLTLVAMFPVLILQWGRVAGLSVTQPALVHHGWVAGVVAVGVQMFFVWRIYMFSGKKWKFPFLLVPIALWQIVGTIPYDVWIFTDDSLAALGAEKMVAFETSIRATSAFVDVMIASLMTFLLVNTGRSSFARSNKMIFRLVAVTINSGIWTAVVAIIDLSLIAAFPHGLQFCAFEFPLSSLYVNTLLANLNARQYLRGKDAGWNVSSTTPQTGTSNIDLRPIGTARSAYTKNETSMNEASMAIRVDTSKVMDTDTYIDVNSSKGHDLA